VCNKEKTSVSLTPVGSRNMEFGEFHNSQMSPLLLDFIFEINKIDPIFFSKVVTLYDSF